MSLRGRRTRELRKKTRGEEERATAGVLVKVTEEQSQEKRNGEEEQSYDGRSLKPQEEEEEVRRWVRTSMTVKPKGSCRATLVKTP